MASPMPLLLAGVAAAAFFFFRKDAQAAEREAWRIPAPKQAEPPRVAPPPAAPPPAAPPPAPAGVLMTAPGQRWQLEGVTNIPTLMRQGMIEKYREEIAARGDRVISGPTFDGDRFTAVVEFNAARPLQVGFRIDVGPWFVQLVKATRMLEAF